MSYEYDNNQPKEEKALVQFITQNLSQTSNYINNTTIISIDKFKKYLGTLETITSPLIHYHFYPLNREFYYQIFLIPTKDSLSIKIEFIEDSNISQLPYFINIQLCVQNRLLQFYTMNYETKFCLTYKTFIKEDYLTYKRELFEQKMLTPLNIRVRVFQSYQNSLNTKVIGILNEGNTCYMNSIIQHLVNLPLIYNKIMEIPSKTNDSLFSLQKLLYNLVNYKGNSSYGIKLSDYMKSTNFLGDFIYRNQQDAQEILSYVFDYVLTREIENKGKSDIAEICKGLLENVVRCNEKNYCSKTPEKFLFLTLPIDNCLTLYECIEKYLEDEKLEGDNALELEGTKHEASKAVSFQSLPNILMLHLKRFTSTNKICKEIIYPDELKLDTFIQDSKPYFLYSVIVHEGMLNHGHYYIYIKRFIEDKWIKCNDNNVSYAAIREVFEDNYGGITNWIEVMDDDGTVFEYQKENHKTAYFLTYINSDYIEKVFCDIEIPKDFENKLLEPSQKLITDFLLCNNNTSNTHNAKSTTNNNQQEITNNSQQEISLSYNTISNINALIDNENQNCIYAPVPLISYEIEVFENDKQTTSTKTIYLDNTEEYTPSYLIKQTVELSHDHSQCKVGLFNSFGLFIQFITDNTIDLKPSFIANPNELPFKIIISNNKSKTKNDTIYVVQSIPFQRDKKRIMMKDYIQNDIFFNTFYLKTHSSNLFQILSSKDDIEKANNIDGIKMKLYDHSSKNKDQSKLIHLVITIMGKK